MRKIILISILIFGMIFMALPLRGASYEDIIVLKLVIGSKIMYVNKTPIEMDVAPVIIEDRTLLPIRWIAEPLGAFVGWDANERKVTVELKDIFIEMWIGKSIAFVNGKPKPIDPGNPKVAPIILPPGRTMIPVRFVAENLGCRVDWDGVTRTVTITYPKESPENNSFIVWRFKTGSQIFSDATIYNGLLYIGSQDSYLYCLDPDSGTLVWKFKAGGSIQTKPYGYNERIYFGSWDRNLYCVDGNTGKLVWKFETKGSILSSPKINDGFIAFGSDDGFLYLLKADNGELIWKFKTDGRIGFSSPLIYKNYVIVGSSDSYLYCVNKTGGSLAWKFKTGKWIQTDPVVYKERVYIGSSDSYIYCLKLDSGELLWKKEVNREETFFSLHNGKIFVSSSYLECLDAETGDKIWENPEVGTYNKPAYSNGKLYCGFMMFYCVNAETGEILWNYNPENEPKEGDWAWIYSTPVIYNKKAYFGSGNTYIYCLNLERE